MRIVLPARVSLSKAFIFASCLVLVELTEGTHLYYALAVFAYFILSTIAFNIAGGFNRPSGAYIFWYATLVAGVGTVYKALLGQAADTNMDSPLTLMLLYCATLLGLLIAAFVTRKVVNTENGFAGLIGVAKLDFSTAALGCLIVVFLMNTLGPLSSGFAAVIVHAIALVNYFLPLGILLGTIAAVQRSNGRHSTSPLVICTVVYATYLGLLSFSKQGMFTPFLSWVIGIAWTKFSLKGKHVLTLVLFAIVGQEFMVPLANIGREEIGDRTEIVINHLLHPFSLKQVYEEHVAGYATEQWYFGTSQGIFDRLTMIPPDSQLVTYTLQGHYFGYLPLVYYFENWVPHIINPHKLEGISVGGNRYAHELERLAEDDSTTGISFSSTAEAFHIDGWFCVILVQPLIFILLFVVTDSVCGDLRFQPWGLLPVLLFAHVAPEQLLGGPITYVWIGNVGTILAILIAGYVAPVFGRLFSGRPTTPAWSAQATIAAEAAPSI